MLVQLAADAINIVESPLNFLSQGHEIFLNHLVDRTHVELRVLQKIQQQFQVAITGTSTDTVNCCIQQVDSIDYGLLRI